MSQMRDRMRAGQLYRADDEQLLADYQRGQLLLARYNATTADQPELRRVLLGQLLGSCGGGVTVQPPLRCDYGQYIHIGEGTFINYDAVLLDVVEIRIGAHCQIAPRVQILTATHPLDPDLRRAGWESGDPVTIEDNVWLGAGAIVLPGVTIGQDSVVGAGSVVTHDLPPSVVAVGNPARPMGGVQ
jgi:maltose O-acetyltransferase